MSMKIKYNKVRNEIVIKGCVDCPFFYGNPRAEFSCDLGVNLIEYQPDIPDFFPGNCPLRDPNFKLTRIIE